MEVIIYLLLYHLHYCTFKENNFRGFESFDKSTQLIYSNVFSDVLFRAASVLQSIILSFNTLNIG